MGSPLDRLLESLDPSRTIDETAARADAAVNSFAFSTGRIEQWDEFRSHLATFVGHVETRVLGLRSALDASTDFYWSRCVQFLQHEFGPGGEKAAFEMARSGAEGGLFAVLRALAGRVAAEATEREITARVNDFWNGLSVDDRLAVSEEYLRKYGHLLPAELTEGSAARIKANFPQVLKAHPHHQQHLRRVGRG